MQATDLIHRLTEIATEIEKDPVITCKTQTDRIEAECLLHHIRMAAQWSIPTPAPVYREGEHVWVLNKDGRGRSPGVVMQQYRFVSGKGIATVMVEIGNCFHAVDVEEKYLIPRWEL